LFGKSFLGSAHLVACPVVLVFLVALGFVLFLNSNSGIRTRFAERRACGSALVTIRKRLVFEKEIKLRPRVAPDQGQQKQDQALVAH